VNQEVKDGEELVLKCKVGGIPKPKVSWTKDGAEITEGLSEQDGVYMLIYEKAGLTQMGKVCGKMLHNKQRKQLKFP